MYRMSISGRTRGRLYHMQVHGGRLINSQFIFFIISLLCLSIKIGAAPSEATVSIRKRQLCLREGGEI